MNYDEYRIENFGRGGGGRGGGGHGHGGHGHGGHRHGTGRRWRGHYGGNVGGYWGGYYGPEYDPYYIGDLAYPYYYYNAVVTPSAQQCVPTTKYDTCDDPYRPVKLAIDNRGMGIPNTYRCCTKYGV